MKILGELSQKLENGDMQKYNAIITEDDGLYVVELYEIFNDGSRSNNLSLGRWASTIGSAKRRLNQDRGWKSKDWNWKNIND